MVKNDSNWGQSLNTEGRYADEVGIGFDAYKFVLDFEQSRLMNGERVLNSRVVMGPDTAKNFLKTFQQSMREYEEQFGWIKEEEGRK